MEYVIGLTGLAAAGALMSKDKKSPEDRRTFAMNQEKNNQVVQNSLQNQATNIEEPHYYDTQVNVKNKHVQHNSLKQ